MLARELKRKHIDANAVAAWENLDCPEQLGHTKIRFSTNKSSTCHSVRTGLLVHKDEGWNHAYFSGAEPTPITRAKTDIESFEIHAMGMP